MPVSIVVGGQFGSEGKGKVTLEMVRRAKESSVTVVRVGGPNSGHTGYNKKGTKFALRQLPAGCIDKNVDVVFPAGSYIEVSVLLNEIAQLDFPEERIFISKYARIITDAHKAWESGAGLGGAIGSTGSGVGGAVMASVARGATNFELISPDAEHCEPLSQFICDTSELLRKSLFHKSRVIVEGSQGFGLSLLDGGYWPKATSRSTTAAAALAEAGLSPIDVDDVTMVLRSFPIRVAGNSGPLPGETNWKQIATQAGRDDDLREYTTVTKILRRVGTFDVGLVNKALEVNSPTSLVMNHLDYVGTPSDLGDPGSRLRKFISNIEDGIYRKIDWYGFSEYEVLAAEKVKAW